MQYKVFHVSPEASLKDQIEDYCKVLFDATNFDYDRLLTLSETIEATFDFFDWNQARVTLVELANSPSLADAKQISIPYCDRCDRRDLEEAQSFLEACINARSRAQEIGISIGQ